MNSLTLLTGATGFVGRQVLKELIAKGIRVHVAVREGKQEQISGIDGIESIITTTDLFAENTEWWADVCKDINTVIHVAWYAEPGKYLQSIINIDCLTGTMQLAKGAAQAKVKRFIGIGTCFEYDLSGCALSIQTELQPLTPYAAAKASAFMMLSQWLPQYGIEFAWCRLFYLYGEGEDDRRLVPYLHKKLAASEAVELTSGNQIRDFLDVRVAGKMIVEVALNKEEQGPINICSGIPITVRQLAEKIADEYGRRDLLMFGVRSDNVIDPPCVVGVTQKTLL